MTATLVASINFSDGAGFNPTLVLGDATTPLGFGQLGASAAVIVDVSSQVTQCSIRRQYARITDTWSPGTATVTIADLNGDWNPDNTSSPYYGKIKPMRKLTLSGQYAGEVYGLFRGYIQTWKYTPANGADVARMEIRAYDAFLLFNNANVSTVTGATAGQTTGTRIGKILDQVAWSSTLRDIDPGKTTCQADPGTVRTTLNALQTVEETELGAFYMDWEGKATFKDRDSYVEAAAVAPTVFTDDETAVPGITYQAVDFGLDDTLIQNAVTVTPAGLAAQYAEDATSIATYFTHSVARTDLLMQTTTDALNQAKAIVKARAYDELRVDSIALNISGDAPAARTIAALDLDFLSNIRVVRTAPGGLIDKTLLIHGVTHDVSPNRWVTTFQTVEPVLEGFILGSAYSGILGTSVLGPY